MRKAFILFHSSCEPYNMSFQSPMVSLSFNISFWLASISTWFHSSTWIYFIPFRQLFQAIFHSLLTSVSTSISFLVAHSSFTSESISSHPSDSFMSSFIPSRLHFYHNFIPRGGHFILTWHLIHSLLAAPSFDISSLLAFISISSLFRLFISARNLFHSRPMVPSSCLLFHSFTACISPTPSLPISFFSALFHSCWHLPQSQFHSLMVGVSSTPSFPTSPPQPSFIQYFIPASTYFNSYSYLAVPFHPPQPLFQSQSHSLMAGISSALSFLTWCFSFIPSPALSFKFSFHPLCFNHYFIPSWQASHSCLLPSFCGNRPKPLACSLTVNWSLLSFPHR